MRIKLISVSTMTLLLVFLVACSKTTKTPKEQTSSQEKIALQRSSWHELGLHGQVQECITHISPAEKKNGEWVHTWSPSNYITTFTKDGMLATETILDQEMNPMDRFIYGSKDQSLVDITYHFGSAESYYGKFIGYGKVKYASDTTMTCLIYSDSTMSGEPIYRIHRTFNKSGRIWSKACIDLKTNRTYLNSSYTYDDQNIQTKSHGVDIYLGEGTFDYVYEYLDFDSHNNWTLRHTTRMGDQKIKHFIEKRTFTYYPNN